jgi:hypothetical protein
MPPMPTSTLKSSSLWILWTSSSPTGASMAVSCPVCLTSGLHSLALGRTPWAAGSQRPGPTLQPQAAPTSLAPQSGPPLEQPTAQQCCPQALLASTSP